MTEVKDLAGKQLGQYVLEELVGEGAFLSVFRGRHPDLPRPVAVKVLNDDLEGGRLTREGTILAKVGGHPNIVNVHDADFNNANPYIVVEYCDKSLDKRIGEGKLEWQTALRYAEQLADGLAHVHAHEIVHGDIKPSNIMLHNGQAKLSDFSTKKIDPKVLLNSLLLSKHTDLQQYMGDQRFHTATALYVSPEHTKPDAEVNAQSDVYQLGQVLHEMVTGERFIHRTTLPSESGAPKWLDFIVAKATENDPKRRYGSAADMRDDIKAGLAGSFNEPGLGTRFRERFTEVVKTAGKRAFIGLKYTGLAVTAPLWGPLALIVKADQVDNGDGWLTVPVIIASIFYYSSVIPITTNCLVENRFEERTRAVAKARFEQTDPDLAMACFAGNELRVTSLNSLLTDSPRTEVYSLPGFVLGSAMKTADETLVYVGTETRNTEEGEKKFPQAYRLDLRNGEIRKMVNVLHVDNANFVDKSVSEIYLVRKGESDSYETALKIDAQWYQTNNGVLEETNKISLPSNQTIQKTVPGTNIAFDNSKGPGWNVQFNREGHWWGDVELFEGRNPMIIRHKFSD